MNNIIKTTVICVFFANIVWAQSESESLSLGTSLDLPKIGEHYFAEKIGNWSLQCIRVEDGNDPCEMKQLLLNAQGQPMSEVSIFYLPKGQDAVAGANIVVPLETLLTTPMVISFDQNTRKQYPYTFCTAVGCVARIGLTEAEIAIMKNGDLANVTVSHISLPNQPITFGMSLKGFTAAYNKIRKNYD